MILFCFKIERGKVKEMSKEVIIHEGGLSEAEAAHRLVQFGANEVEMRRDVAFIVDLAKRFLNPLILLLISIASFSFFFGDVVSSLVITAMIVMSVGFSFVQERRAHHAAQMLNEIVETTCEVIRDGVPKEIPLKRIVPGDVVKLSAGDIVPGDIAIIEAHGLFVNQSSLTGESFPIEKFAGAMPTEAILSPHTSTMAFMGSSVVSGSGIGKVVHTGRASAFGALTQKLIEAKSVTAFDRQLQEFVWLMMRVILAVVVGILGIRAIQHHALMESALFALAVAVQITPETLPMIMTLNLSRGALIMARKKVIVKRLNAVQNLGAMDVLCADKTGTLTMNEVVLERHVNVFGEEEERVFMYGYLNSFYQTGLRNLLNAAVLRHKREDMRDYTKLDELPFDFERKINSVIVTKEKTTTLIAIGSPEEIIVRCSAYDAHGTRVALSAREHGRMLAEYTRLSAQGFRVLAVAVRAIEERLHYTLADEHELVLMGYMAFLDPAKPSARAAIAALAHAGVALKVVTGDSELVTQKICADLGIESGTIMVGDELETLSAEALALRVEHTTVFARMTPEHKERIVRSFSAHGHVVGYLGDGINDSLSLRAADIGISVNNAVDVAKESAGIVLLEKNLHVLLDGVFEGRKVYANFMNYIRMTSMVNTEYMITTMAASVILPFLPMAPVQMLLNNYLYEVGQLGIPGDNVDSDLLRRPRAWHMRSVFRFMMVLGPSLRYLILCSFSCCGGSSEAG